MKQFRNTIQRDVVLQTIQLLSGQHPTAEDIYQMVIQQHPHISRGTVYRNLNLLCEKGIIAKLPTENGADRFDDQVLHHAHFQCRNCGKIFDVALTAVSYSAKMQKEGFIVEDDVVWLKGLCPECAKKGGNEA